MSVIAEQIIASHRTAAPDGSTIKGSSFIALEEGHALRDLVSADPTITRTLEVGCAQGVSSLFICDALKGRAGARHTMLDPFQHTDWQGAGIAALQRAGLDNYELVEERSEFALPDLVRRNESFDLVFIDGWHTLDHALVDAFYATRLLRVGGYLALDDTAMPPLDKLSRYLAQYPCYIVHQRVMARPASPLRRAIAAIGGLLPIGPNLLHRIPRRYRGAFSRPRMVILKKVAGDCRRWNWYAPF